MANEIIGLSESQKKARLLMVLLAFILFSAFFVSPAFASHDPSHLPGTLDSTGTLFQIIDSSYLNITLNSSQSIKLNLQSVPEMITMQIEADLAISPPPISTQITLSGLSPNTIHYLYQDNYHNETQFVADENGGYSFIQDISIPHLLFIQPRKSTKFISDNQTGGDCSAIGTWNPSTKTCALTQDVFETIQIDSDNITLDGNNHIIIGTNTGSGIYLSGRTGVTIKNLIIQNFSNGIYLTSSNHNTFSNNVLTNNGFGSEIWLSNHNTVVNNTIKNNWFYGTYFHVSNNNLVNANSFLSNGAPGLFFEGWLSYNNAIINNVFALHGSSYALALIFSASNNQVSNNTFSSNYGGVFLYSSGSNQIYNNNLVSNSTQAFAGSSSGNLFNLSLPQGGNHWSNCDTPQEGCNDTNNDKVCDSPYVFTGGQDNYPWTIQNGWIAPTNQPPTISNLNQYKSDGTTTISENGITQELTVIFKATLSDPDNDQIKLQIELKEFAQSFDGTNLIESTFVSSGSTASITRYGLIPESYRWRARAMDSQGGVSNWMEFGVAGAIDFAVGRTIKIAVILAEPSDKSFDPSHNKQYFETQIIPNVKDYYCEVSFGTRPAQTDPCRDGLVNLDFEVFDNNGVPYKLLQSQQYYGEAGLFNVEITITDANQQSITESEPDRTLEFIWDAINKADIQSNLNYNLYDSVMVVYSGESQTYVSPLEAIRTKDFMRDVEVDLSFAPLASLNEQAKNWIAVAEQDLIGPWAHEIGHASGRLVANQVLCDLYVGSSCGNVKEWDLMGDGVDLGVPKGSMPSHLSSYSKQKLRWLNSEFENLSYGPHTINALAKQNFGDKIKRFNLSDTSYYLLEARTKDSRYSRWDTALPHDALVLYKVRRGTTSNKEVVNLVQTLQANSLPFFNPFNNILISANNFLYEPSAFKIETEIQPLNLTGYTGITLQPDSLIWNVLIDLGVISQKEPLKLTQTATNQYPYDKVAPEQIIFDESGRLPGSLKYDIFYPVLFYAVIILIVAYLLASILKDERRKKTQKLIIILGIIFLIIWILFRGLIFLLEKRYIMIQKTPDNVYASLISALNTVIASPDLDLHAITPDGKHTGVNYQTGEYENQIPNAITSGDLVYDDEWIFVPQGIQVKYYVSSNDIQQFLEQNPDIAQQLPTTQETYTMSAMYYDSQSQKFESTPLENQPINPGEEIIHQTQGTTDIQVSQGITDNQGPIISHRQLQSEYLLNSQPIVFNFSADDQEGVGVKEINAKLDGNPITNNQTISFNQIGTHTVEIIATDHINNVSTETINYKVVYQFGGFLSPIKPDGSGIYKLGRTLPIKFQLTDANNQYISTAIAQLLVAKISNGIIGTDEIPLSTSSADTGNLFRYDQTNNQYIYNLSTDTLSAGSWQLKVVLEDGKYYTVVVSVK